MNTTSLMPGMVLGFGGQYAIQLDEKNMHYGWLFELKPCGWVSLRKALPVEMEAAHQQVRYNEFFTSLTTTQLIH